MQVRLQLKDSLSPQQSMHMYIFKSWIIFSFHRQKNWFGDDEVIFQDDKVYCKIVKGI